MTITFTEAELEERYEVLKSVRLTTTVPIRSDNPHKDEQAKYYAIYAELARRGRLNAWTDEYGETWYYTEATIQDAARLRTPA